MPGFKINLFRAGQVFIFLSLACLPFIYSEKFIDPVLILKATGLAVLLALSLFYFYKISSGRAAVLIPAAPVVYAWLGYLFFTAISLAVTINFADGLFEWLRACLYFLFLLFLFSFFYGSGQKPYLTIAVCATILSLVINVHGMVQLTSLPAFPNITHNDTYNVRSLFAHRNLYSEVIFLLLPFTLFAAFEIKSWWRLLPALASLLSVINITITLSRAVWLALILFAIVCVVFYLAGFSSKKIKAGKVGLIVLFTLGLVAAAIWYYSRVDSFETFEKQAHGIVHFNYGTSRERIELWKRSFEIFSESPVTGSGVGSWKIEILKFGPDKLQSEDGVTFFQRPHNDFIWVLSESGIPALLGYLGIFIFGLWGYWRLLKPGSRYKILFVLMAGGLAGYAVISMFSFPRERPEQQVLLACLFLPLLLESGYKVGNRLSRFFSVASIVLIAGMLWVFATRAVAEIQLSQAFRARQAKSWNQVIEKTGQAYGTLYKIDPMSTPLPWYTGSAYFNVGKVDKATAFFESAYHLNPWHIHVLNNLATCYELKGDHKKAEEFYLKALSIFPSFNDALLNLTAVYYNTGEYGKAYQTLRKADMELEGYGKFSLAILPKVLAAFPEQISHPGLEQKIKAILHSPDWLFQIHKKSVMNNISLERQLVIDAVYIMHKTEKSITFEESEIILDQYDKL